MAQHRFTRACESLARVRRLSLRDWLFEPKWDGFRAICFLESGSVRFVSRNRKSLTTKFPALQSIANSIRATNAVLDGEIVAIDEASMPRFNLLRAKEQAGGHLVVYYGFDLLYLDGKDLTQKSVIERKALLKGILPKRQVPRLRYTDHVVGDGKEMFAELSRLKLEGMVAKRCDSVYGGGRTRAWLKVKTATGKEEMLRRSETWGH
jgi:bifunctional non-homologous end joining protein LigD